MASSSQPRATVVRDGCGDRRKRTIPPGGAGPQPFCGCGAGMDRRMTHRLFVYGTLAPGRSNAHVLSGIPGTWEPAAVTGTLYAEAWGAAAGFPGLVPDSDGGEVPGLLFTSDALPAHWARLDAFEGEGYERVPTRAVRSDGTVVDAWVYRLSRLGLPPDAAD